MVGGEAAAVAAGVRSVGYLSAASDSIVPEGFPTRAENQACPCGAANARRAPPPHAHRPETKQTEVMKWEQNVVRIAFLGYEPVTPSVNPTGDAARDRSWEFASRFICLMTHLNWKKARTLKRVPAVCGKIQRGSELRCNHRHWANLTGDTLHKLLRIAKVPLGLDVQPNARGLAEKPAKAQ